jgi:signal transduction histidine kinase
MAVLEDIIKDASPFPLVDLSEPTVPRPGLIHPTPKFCEKVFPKGKCAAFYKSATPGAGRQQCPYGFTVWPTTIGTQKLAVTALIGAPRLGGDDERMRAKDFPENKVDAEAVDAWIRRMVKILREGTASREDEFARKLDALHEIRKFNSIVKTSMERACDAASPSDPDQAPPDLVRALRASSLISGQLDALDLLANPESAMTFNPRRWVFYRTVDKIVRTYRVLADNRKVKVVFRGGSVATAWIDDRTIHIIPSAFVDNAVKYSPPGATVEVTVADEARDGKPMIGLRVRSEGPPASVEEERMLFRQRGRGKEAKGIAEGSGVGLSLAKVVADQHGGTIGVEQRHLTNNRSEWVFVFFIPAC